MTQTSKVSKLNPYSLPLSILLSATSLTACQNPQPTVPIATASPVLPISSATPSPERPVIDPDVKPSPSPLPAASAQVSAPPVSTNIKLPKLNPLQVASGTFTSMSFQLSTNPVHVQVGKTLCLTALALNETGQILNNVPLELLWQSQQPAVASVNREGCVTSLANGETQIQATAKDSPGITATVGIRVSTESPAAPAQTQTQTQAFDFNGDGQQDWLIGYGSTYRLFLGQGGPLPVDALKPENMPMFQFPNADTIEVEERIYPTNTVTGDLNGDGYDDIAIGHKYGINTGEVAIFFGNPYPLKYYNLQAPDVSIPPAPKTRPGAKAVIQSSYKRIGRKLAIADLDHDGMQDLLVDHVGYQNKGAVHLFLGRKSWPDSLSPEDADAQLIRSREEEAEQYRGFAISFVTGDFNGDSWTDVAVGEGDPRQDKSNVLDLNNPDQREENRQGKVHVFLGGAKAWRSKTDLEADYRVLGTPQTVIDGPSSNTVELSTQTIGQGLGSADLDGDGKDELVVRVAHIFQFAFRGPNGTHSPPSADAFKERLRVFRGQDRPGGSVLTLDQSDGGVDDAGYNFYDAQIFTADINHDGVKDVYGFELVPASTQRNFYGYDQPVAPNSEYMHFYDGKRLLGPTAIKPTGMLKLRTSLGEKSKHYSLATAFDGGPGSELLFYDDQRQDGKTCFFITGLPSTMIEYSALSRRFCLP